MPATIISHQWNDNFSQDVEVVRHVGETRNISVEVWRSKASDRIALVVSPTVQGFSILALGGPEEVETFAKVGGCVLAALAGVVPLVAGDLFKAPVGREGMPAAVRQ